MKRLDEQHRAQPSLFDQPQTGRGGVGPGASRQVQREANGHPEFDGATYEPAADKPRLAGALARVYAVMSDGKRRTLAEIADAANTSHTGVSARIRDLRKDKFRAIYPNTHVGAERVEGGLWVYWLEGAANEQRK